MGEKEKISTVMMHIFGIVFLLYLKGKYLVVFYSNTLYELIWRYSTYYQNEIAQINKFDKHEQFFWFLKNSKQYRCT